MLSCLRLVKSKSGIDPRTYGRPHTNVPFCCVCLLNAIVLLSLGNEAFINVYEVLHGLFNSSAL